MGIVGEAALSDNGLPWVNEGSSVNKATPGVLPFPGARGRATGKQAILREIERPEREERLGAPSDEQSIQPIEGRSAEGSGYRTASFPPETFQSLLAAQEQSASIQGVWDEDLLRNQLLDTIHERKANKQALSIESQAPNLEQMQHEAKERAGLLNTAIMSYQRANSLTGVSSSAKYVLILPQTAGDIAHLPIDLEV